MTIERRVTNLEREVHEMQVSLANTRELVAGLVQGLSDVRTELEGLRQDVQDAGRALWGLAAVVVVAAIVHFAGFG